jgi:hypothetical protein
MTGEGRAIQSDRYELSNRKSLTKTGGKIVVKNNTFLSRPLRKQSNKLNKALPDMPW